MLLEGEGGDTNLTQKSFFFLSGSSNPTLKTDIFLTEVRIRLEV